MSLTIDLLLLAGSTALGGLCYYLLTKNEWQMCAVENAVKVPINLNLVKHLEASSDHEIPYVCVEGMVHPVKASLKSKFREDIVGVVKTNKRYKMRPQQYRDGVWHMRQGELICKSLEDVPFVLQTPMEIAVTGATNARYFIESLRSTHNDAVFEKNKSRPVNSEGFEDENLYYKEVETMLPTGVSLLGFGKLVLKRGCLVLQTPDIDYPYIVTLFSHKEVLQRMQDMSVLYKIVVGTSLCFAICSLYYVLKHFCQKQSHSNPPREAYKCDFRDSFTDVFLKHTCLICSVQKHISDTSWLKCYVCGHISICGECYATTFHLIIVCPNCNNHVEYEH